MNAFFSKLSWWLQRPKRESELHDELQFHLEEEVEQHREDGLAEQEARWTARRELGNPTLVEENTRAVWGWITLEQFVQDVRYALRSIRRSPGVAVVAMLSLALGIGVNTAIFSLMDALMLKSLPVKNPEQLILIGDGVSSGSTDDEPSGKWSLFSYPVYQQLHARNRVFSDMLAFLSTSDRSLAGIDGGEPELILPKLVSGNYFSVLGIRPVIGRTLTPDDDTAAANPVAVLSYSYWERRFARNADVIGKRIVLRSDGQTGVAVQIVGVAARGFFGEKAGAIPNFWMPLSVEGRLEAKNSWLNDRAVSCLQLFGRLKEGVNERQARTNIDLLFRQILIGYAGPKPSDARRRAIERTYADMGPAGRGISSLRTLYSEPLEFLFALTGAVLLIACANVANLLLARAAARQREIAVRVAIGAGHLRLIRQLLTESIVLAAAGGALGFLFALWASQALARFVSGPTGPLLLTQINLRMLFFTGLLSLLTGVAFGLAPALSATRAELQATLKESSGTTSGRQKLRLGRLLVAAQVALTLLLVVAAGAFVKSLQNLRNLDPGFKQDNAVVFELDTRTLIRMSNYDPVRLTSLYDRLLEKVSGLPGVTSASLSRVTYSRGIWGDRIWTPGDAQGHIVRGNFITPKYFETMGIKLLAGRSFRPQDSSTAPLGAIINETLARKFFPGRSVVGEHLQLGNPSTQITILGVVRDFKYHHLREDTPPLVFLSYAQYPGNLPFLTVRTSTHSPGVTTEIRRAIQEVTGSVPLVEATKLANLVDQTLSTEDLVARLASFFGLLAVMLSCIGIYGILSYAVAVRTNEIGIRVALGATPQQVRWIILRDMLRLVAGGLVAGLAAVAAGQLLVGNMLFGLKGTDPLTLTGACALVLAIAAVAAYLPARRASRVDPLLALRAE
jgi:predicted permease